jgi:hypothetical protein
MKYHLELAAYEAYVKALAALVEAKEAFERAGLPLPERLARVGGTAAEPTPHTLIAAMSKAAAALGRRGGVAGGHARAAALSPKRRSAIAKKAAEARWGKGPR